MFAGPLLHNCASCARVSWWYISSKRACSLVIIRHVAQQLSHMPSESATKALAMQTNKTLYQEWSVDEDEAAVGMEAELVFYPNGNKVTRYRNTQKSVNWHYGKRPQVRQLSGLSPDRATKFSHPLGSKKNSGGKVTAKADKPVSVFRRGFWLRTRCQCGFTRSRWSTWTWPAQAGRNRELWVRGS